MKNYPRLFSLSTVGIIHHQDYDYYFHPFRTDFIGDSGSGKSMIADMLQLILVGSDRYESATETTGEKRWADGMVLTEVDASGIGYAFLNVEIAPKKYLVVGTYLESGNTRSRAFMVQADYEFASGSILSPMDRPLSCQDLIGGNNAIIPIDQLLVRMVELGFGAKVWEHFHEYHQLLTENRLIPVQLNPGHKALDDYARIIRSFSRGYKLKASDSNKLQHFLFGTVDSDKLYKRLKATSASFKKTMGVHAENIITIEQLTKKLDEFRKLRLLQTDYEKSEINWLTASYIYWHQQHKDFEEKTQTAFVELEKDFYRLEQIRLAVESSESTVNKNQEKAKFTYENLVSEEIRLKKIQTNIKQVRRWITEKGKGGSINDLIILFQEDNRRHNQQKLLNQLQNLLKQHKLTKQFENSEWNKGYEKGSISYNKLSNKLKNQIAEKQLLSQFIDLTNPDSLGSWAVRQNRPLTIEEESALHYFQKFPRNQPEEKSGERFIPEPDELFRQLKSRKSEKGFWLNLSGTQEFVDKVSTPLFSTTDQETIAKHIRKWHEGLKDEIRELECQQEELDRLYNFIESITNISSMILTYKDRDILHKYVYYSDWFNVDEKEFIYQINEFQKNEGSIIGLFKENQANKKQAWENLSLVNSEQGCLVDISRILNSCPKLDAYNDISGEDVYKQKNISLNVDYKNIVKATESIKALYDELVSIQQKRLSIEKWREVLQNLILAEQNQSNARLLYNEKSNDSPEFTAIFNSNDLGKLKSEFDKFLGAYTTKYTSLADDYLKSQSYLVNDGKYDFVKLATESLPNLIRDKVNSEEGVIQAIDTELNRINDQTRRFADAKIREVDAIVDDLIKAINWMKSSRKSIQEFLNNSKSQYQGLITLDYIGKEEK